MSKWVNAWVCVKVQCRVWGCTSCTGSEKKLWTTLWSKILAAVDRCERLLRQVVVESGRPLPRPHARGVRAVVHHERDAAGVHVRVEAVHRLDDRLVADLRVRVPLPGVSRTSQLEVNNVARTRPAVQHHWIGRRVTSASEP